MPGSHQGRPSSVVSHPENGQRRLLGVDLGDRRVGVAIADMAGGTIRPLATLHRADVAHDAASLGRLATEQRVSAIIVGLPLLADGREGAQAMATREWVQAVGQRMDVPITLRDERFTSVLAAGRAPRPRRGTAGGPPTGRARHAHRARIDREAAVAILQAELDARAEVGS